MLRVLSQADIQVRLAYVSCVRQLEEVKNADYCDYIRSDTTNTILCSDPILTFRPPIDKYGTLQFEAFDEIREVGYYHGRTYFAGLRKAGQLWFMQQLQDRRGSLESQELSHRSQELSHRSQQLKHRRPSGGTSYARFTDLAEMVCRVRTVTPDRSGLAYQDMELDTDPDESDILSEGDELEEEESGFISNACPDDVLPSLGLNQRTVSRPL